MNLFNAQASHWLRLLHDFLVASFAALTTALFCHFFVKDVGLGLVLGLLVVPVLYFCVSVLGQVRTPQLVVQVITVLGAAALSAVLMTAAGESAAVVALFHVLLVPLLLAPRYYLNVKKSSDSFIGNLALKNKGSVLVVGGAGYIGTHLVDILLNKNYSVRVLDRLIYGKGTLEKFFQNPRFEFVEGDATDISKLVLALRDCSAVVHLGGLVGDPACSVDPEFTRHENVISTRMVREAAKAAGVGRFVFASSCSVYGSNDDVVNELSPLNPVSLYATTKIDSEKELLAANDENFHVTILRFATVFGHSLRPRFDLVANLFTAQAFNDGKITVMGSQQWRPMVHCRDIARAVEKVVSAPSSKVHGQTFNVGDDRLNVTIGDLGDIVAKVAKDFGKPAQVIVNNDSNDRRNYRVSFAKIKEVLGFEREFDLETGVREIYKNFAEGKYKHYKDQGYSNFETTKQQVSLFYDPIHTSGMYRPLNEGLAVVAERR
jgi:nucleoside-diphosphate-sugar epimerase